MSKKVRNKTLDEMIREWDSVSIKRQLTIEAGKDVSLLYVTAPCIIRNLEGGKSKILDAGCGTGYLTNQISKLCDLCYGIDANKGSIEIARRKYSEKIIFEHTSISTFDVDFQFDACVSNMVLMNDPEWEVSLKRIYKLLKINGQLLIMLTHPCFWPLYWGYNNEPWFKYEQESYIQHNFSTSFSESLGITTHIHRPISVYLNTLMEIGFKILKIEEPQPVENTPKDYRYEYPRFLFIKCEKY